VKTLGKFDVILINAVLHHLTDAEIGAMLKHATTILKPAGRLVTIDPTIDAGQHPIARLLARLDRGRHVRTTDRYRELVSRHFAPVQVIVRHDLLRIPFTQCIMTSEHREECNTGAENATDWL
jgi:SAM-dependent methyltransferase